ncbi:hypothetical protein IF188_17875 [Microbacterium sp. NEAU-LLC]|uniref:Uncharacterized protein n=1 Tax=Microbacterium helvum TaxID=2773713 RepID=A0ABR8NSF3_9MICO|nr:hypothetical protein [Microbacterium helvum]MBD3943563.1 hypothetical protein [Microbacterium helvum]
MMRVSIHTDLVAYQAAAGQLAATTLLAPGTADAVCVVGGAGAWCERGRALLTRGARAIVVDDPAPAGRDEIAGLREAAALRGVPVVLDRPRLRPDVAADAANARGDVALLSGDAFAAPNEQQGVARDLCGWLRVLGGGPVRIEHAAAGRAAVIVAGRSPAGVAVAASLTITATTSARGTLEVVAIGASRVGVHVDEASGTATIETESAAGRLSLPPRFERRQRVALRRALDALEADEAPVDLRDLESDACVSGAFAAAASA